MIFMYALDNIPHRLLSEYYDHASSNNNLQYMSLEEHNDWINKVQTSNQCQFIRFYDSDKDKNIMFYVVKQYKDKLNWKLCTSVVTEKFSVSLYKAMKHSLYLFAQYIKENNGVNLIVYIHNRNRWILNIGQTTLGLPNKNIVNNNSIRELVWSVNDI
jgi:hypothetical protein